MDQLAARLTQFFMHPNILKKITQDLRYRFLVYEKYRIRVIKLVVAEMLANQKIFSVLASEFPAIWTHREDVNTPSLKKPDEAKEMYGFKEHEMANKDETDDSMPKDQEQGMFA
jgi:hypothetical protein